MSNVYQIEFRLRLENQEHSMHWWYQKCPALHFAHGFVLLYLKKIQCTPLSYILLVNTMKFRISRSKYLLDLSPFNDLKPLAAYRMTSSSQSIVNMEEHNIFLARQQNLISLYFQYILLVQDCPTIYQLIFFDNKNLGKNAFTEPSSFRLGTI